MVQFLENTIKNEIRVGKGGVYLYKGPQSYLIIELCKIILKLLEEKNGGTV